MLYGSNALTVAAGAIQAQLLISGQNNWDRCIRLSAFLLVRYSWSSLNLTVPTNMER